MLNSFVILVLLYGRKCWTMSSQKKNILEAREMWFYRISVTEHGRKNNGLSKIVAKRMLILRIRK